MDLYTLGATLLKKDLIEDYQSLIWTERYSSIGDFELVLANTSDNRALLTEGTRLVVNVSQRIMIVKVVEETVDDDDVEILKVSGRSFEAVLEDRGAVRSADPVNSQYYYELIGTPGYCARILFYAHAYTGIIDIKDKIPFIQYTLDADLTKESYLREPQNQIAWIVEPANLYQAIKALCDLYSLGFRIVRLAEDSKLYFQIYPGLDRTSNQTVVDPIILSSDLDTIQNTKSLKSNLFVKNVAYCVSSAVTRTIYADGVDPNASGFERKVVVIDLGDKGPPPTAGEFPVRPPEPDPGQWVMATEPDYGYPDPPLEPMYEPQPTDPDPAVQTAWRSQRDIDRVNWELDRQIYLDAWNSNRDAQRENWINENIIDYLQWVADKDAARAAWINDYDVDVANWYTETQQLQTQWYADIWNEMSQRAAEALAKQAPVNSFDGELDANLSLRYGIDYDLGDLLELRNHNDKFFRRITEQIFVKDVEGFRSYPTLSEPI